MYLYFPYQHKLINKEKIEKRTNLRKENIQKYKEKWKTYNEGLVI